MAKLLAHYIVEKEESETRYSIVEFTADNINLAAFSPFLSFGVNKTEQFPSLPLSCYKILPQPLLLFRIPFESELFRRNTVRHV